MVTIEELVKRQRREIDRTDAATMERLVNAYKLRYEKMRRDADALVAYVAAQDGPTVNKVKQSPKYKALVREYEADLAEYTTYLKTEIDVTTRASLTTGEKHALALIGAYGVVGRGANVAGLPKDVISVMMRFLAPDSALYQRIQQLAPFHAEQIASHLVEAVVNGYNPLVTGKEMIAPLLSVANKVLLKSAGQALTDALRMARTSQLWAYRESSRAAYVANQDVVRGWYWSAELDDSTCMSCIAQHGTFHELTEQLDDHHNGRCAMVPAVIGAESPISQTGEEWFNSQSEASQRKMMGSEYYAAYQGGAFSLAEMSRQVEDPVYGHMHNVTPLYSLLGAEPPVTK